MPDISVNRTTYIKIGSASPITTGIAEGSMLIDRVLFAEDFKFGQFASSRFEIQIYGINNVAGQNIEVYQTENNVRTDLFVGQIESSKLDNAGYYRDIIAYDKFYFIAKKNVADWFNGLWTNNTQISVLDAFKSLLTYFDIDYDTNTVVAANFTGNLYKTSVPSFEKISFKDMVKFLLEPLALIPYINASGDVAVFAPSMANSVDLVGKYDKNESVFEEYEVLPIQWVGIANIDSAILVQEEITGNTSDIRYDLPYNPIRLDLYVEDAETAQEAVLEDFIDKAPFDAYTPCEVLMIVSDMSIKLGDKITTTRGTSYVSEMILSGPMLVEQQLISRGSQVQQEVEEEYDPVFAYLDNKVTEATEDLQDQIDNFEPSEEYLNKVNEFSSAVASGMGLKTIKRIQDGATITYFYAPDANGAITNSKFVFVMKSNGFFWTNEWKGNADASSEGNTSWGQGIGSDGSSLLKILNAYKISADIIDTGELVIRDQQDNIIHKFSYNDLSALIGGANGISYNASTGKTTIGSDVDILGSVTIGGSATIGQTIIDAVDDAVDDLNIVGIDHTDIHYQSSTSNTTIPTGTWSTTIPSVSAGRYLWTRTTIYYTDHTQQDPHTSVSYSVARQGSNGTSVSISSIQYGTSSSASTEPSNYSTTVPTSLTKGTWLWTKTTYSNNSTAITKAYIGTDGEDGISVTISEPTRSGNSVSFNVTDENGTKTVTLYDGQDGDDGDPGANGYVHIAWADSITFNQGGEITAITGFSTNNSVNKKYIGTYSDNTQADSQNYTDYSWTKIKGDDGSQIDNQDILYAISSDGSTPPGDTGSETSTWYFSDSSNYSNASSTIQSTFGTQNGWDSFSDPPKTSISLTSWGSNRTRLYAFERVDNSDGTYEITNGRLIATYGSGSSSTTLATETLYFATNANTWTGSSINNNWNSQFKSIASSYITDINWNSSYKYLYTATRTIKQDGSTTTSASVKQYNNGSSSTVLETQRWFLSNYNNNWSDSEASTINGLWFMSGVSDKRATHYFEADWGGAYYNNSELNCNYLYTLNRTVFADGSSEITDVSLVATKGISYPPMGDNPWSYSIPNITANKGKYLWTKTSVSYTDGTVVDTYTVSYIAVDGQNGTNGSAGAAGKGISSITQYFKASTSGSVAPSSGYTTTASDAGFSSTNRYLWTYTVTAYTNNTSSGSISDAYVLGVWGQDGSGGSGTQGRGIASITPQYALSSSSSAPSSNSALWKNSPDEYPNIGNMPKSVASSINTGQNEAIVLNNITLKSGVTYTITYNLDSAVNTGTYIRLIDNSYNTLKQITLTSGSTSQDDTYIATSDKSGCMIAIYSANKDLDYSITINAARMYYYQRDKIEWTDGSSATYTSGVRMEGYNAAIYTMNRLNPCFIEAELGGSTQVMIDAGHLYADSVTAYNIAAYEAFIKNLMANYVQVDGNVDVINGDITVTQAPVSTEAEMSQSYLDSYCQANYGAVYANLNALIKPMALMKALSSYLASIMQAAALAAKMQVKTNDGTQRAALYPNGSIVSDSSSSKFSYYGISGFVGGDFRVNGSLTAGNIQKGTKTIALHSNGYSSIENVTFDTQFENMPVVVATPHSPINAASYSIVAVITSTSTSGFSLYLGCPGWASTGDVNITCDWIAIS